MVRSTLALVRITVHHPFARQEGVTPFADDFSYQQSVKC